jgi:hypothetical protein
MEQPTQRGNIKHKARAQQINSFSGLIRRRNITPTDIDGLIDYNGKAFIILEGKYGDAKILRGQKLALENLAKAINSGNKIVTVLIYRHFIDVDNEVDVCNQIVSEIFFKNKWTTINTEKNVLEWIERFELFCENNHCEI